MAQVDTIAISADMAHLPLNVAQAVSQLSKSVGPPPDQMRFILCILGTFPLAYLHKFLPNATLKHAYSLFWGLFYVWFVTGVPGVVHPLVSSLCVYAICALLPRKTAPLVSFVFLMAYLSASHIYRLYTDYLGWTLDFTTAQMILTAKCAMFAYNYADGQALNKGELLDPIPKVHASRELQAIRKLPSLLEYLAFVLFFPAVLTGPCFEIKYYLDFTDGTLFKKAGFTTIPSSTMPMLKCIVAALAWYGGVFASGYFPTIGYMNTDSFVTGTTFLYRVGYIWLAMSLFRAKYYFAWYLAEAGCLASGFGFIGKMTPEQAKQSSMRFYNGVVWNGAANANSLEVELGTALPSITNNWNMGINNWLKNYVYFRLKLPSALARNLVTKMTSAFWHGFYPSYYLFFLSVGLINHLESEVSRVMAYFFKKGDKDGKDVPAAPRNPVVAALMSVCTWMLLYCNMNYCGASFALLRADWTLTVWKSVYFYTHAAIVVTLLLALLVPKPKRQHKHSSATAQSAGSETTPSDTPASAVARVAYTASADGAKPTSAAVVPPKSPSKRTRKDD